MHQYSIPPFMALGERTAVIGLLAKALATTTPPVRVFQCQGRRAAMVVLEPNTWLSRSQRRAVGRETVVNAIVQAESAGCRPEHFDQVALRWVLKQAERIALWAGDSASQAASVWLAQVPRTQPIFQAVIGCASEAPERWRSYVAELGALPKLTDLQADGGAA